jgi:hypothetical protein
MLERVPFSNYFLARPALLEKRIKRPAAVAAAAFARTTSFSSNGTAAGSPNDSSHRERSMEGGNSNFMDSFAARKRRRLYLLVSFTKIALKVSMLPPRRHVLFLLH